MIPMTHVASCRIFSLYPHARAHLCERAKTRHDPSCVMRRLFRRRLQLVPMMGGMPGYPAALTIGSAVDVFTRIHDSDHGGVLTNFWRHRLRERCLPSLKRYYRFLALTRAPARGVRSSG